MDQPARIRPVTDGIVRIELAGDIDYTNSGTVVSTMQSTLTAHGPTVVCVDLAAVTFLDSSGIGVLVIANQLAGTLGAAFEVVRPSRNVFEQLRITGLVDLFGIAPPAGH
jgi:anti-sigma B factor antagonist